MSQISRDQLMAYADGQLSPDERAAVEAYLAANADAAAEVALLQRQNDARDAQNVRSTDDARSRPCHECGVHAGFVYSKGN